MGLFGKLFEKKECAVCGGEIGLLGNRKLEDGNLCKHCAAKLSPWFSERRSSTVEQIKEQLAYREENRKAVEKFHTTRTLGGDVKLHLDEEQRKFMVTRARNIQEANPDVLDYSQVTGVEFDINEHSREQKRQNSEGKQVSYTPPRYYYEYSFRIKIRVNHPYFDEMSFNLSSSNICTNPETAVPAVRKPDEMRNHEYMEYYDMGMEIKEILTSARKQSREEAAPKKALTCPWCGATTTPDANGCCEYCGGSLKD